MIEPAGPLQPSRPTAAPKAPAPAGAPEAPPADSFAAAPEKEWTVLAYLDGSNEMREYLTGNAREMEVVGSTDRTDVAVYLSRDERSLTLRNLPYRLGELGRHRTPRVESDWRGSRVYHVEKGAPGAKELSSTLIEDHGRESVRDPMTLQRFVEMGMKRFPAKHYLVVLSGHGHGFRGMLTDRDGKSMSLPEVRTALEGAQAAAGRKIDVLALESCKMGQLEVAYELKGSADYLVASPGNMYNEALNYATVLGEVDGAQKSGRPVSPEEMAKILVASTDGAPDEVPTLTALDLRKMPAVRDALDEVASALGNGKTADSVIERLIFDSPHYDTSRHSGYARKEREFVDILGFCNRIVKSARVTDPQLKDAAAALKKAVDQAIVEKRVHEGEPSDQGLSAYLPTGRGLAHPIDPDYTDLKIAAESGWDDRLMGGRKDYLKALTRYVADKMGGRS